MNKRDIERKKKLRSKAMAEYKARWYRENRDKMKAYAAEYYEKNKETLNKRTPERQNWESVYRRENRKRINKYHREYMKKRRKEDPAMRAIQNARVRALDFIRGNQKYSKRLGCSFKEFKDHIESLFSEGMTWENYGKWEIDHKYPLSVAFKEGPEIFANACKYTNLQPLWRSDNIKKGNKVILDK